MAMLIYPWRYIVRVYIYIDWCVEARNHIFPRLGVFLCPEDDSSLDYAKVSATIVMAYVGNGKIRASYYSD